MQIFKKKQNMFGNVNQANFFQLRTKQKTRNIVELVQGRRFTATPATIYFFFISHPKEEQSFCRVSSCENDQL